MEKKRFVFLTVMAIGILLSLTPIANAEMSYFICKIEHVTVNRWGKFMSLTHAEEPYEFDHKVFRIPEDLSDEMLAMALVAVSNELYVTIKANPDEKYGELAQLYLLNKDFVLE